MTRQPINATPCPACGPAGPLAAHLVAVHGFGKARAIFIARRIIARERLSAGDCAKLGIPNQAVKVKGAMNPEKYQAVAMPGLPSDADLDESLRRAGFEVRR